MRHLMASFAGTAAIQLANLASGILTARLLLPEGRGQLAAIMLWPGLIAAVGGLSLNTAAAYAAARDDVRPGAIFATVTALAATLAVALVLIGLGAIPFAYAGQAPIVFSLAALALAFIPLNLFGLSWMAILQGRLAMGAFNVLRALMPLGYVAFILVALAAGRADLTGFVLAFLAANTLVAVGAVGALARAGCVGVSASRAVAAELLRYAASSHLGYAITVLAQRLDQALIALFLPAQDLGLYVVALASGGAAMLIGGTMELVAFPKSAAERDEAGRAAVVARYVRATIALAALAAIVLIPLLPWLIELLFGRAFAPAAEPARILALAALPGSAKAVLNAGLRGAGRPFDVARTESVVLVALGISMVVLLPRAGVSGAAWAVVIAQAAGALAAAVWARGALRLPWRALLVPDAGDLDRLRRLLGRGGR
jgi:O-antigen/teichoic acid export membrane protein